MAEQEDIKPQINEEDASVLARNLFGLEIISVRELNSYDDRNFHIAALKSSNPHIPSVSSHGYVLKIINTTDSQNVSFFEAQTDLLLFLESANLSAPIPRKNILGQYLSVEEFHHKNSQRHHIVRLFDFQPGEILNKVPGAKQLYYQVGVLCANLDFKLQSFHHPALESHTSVWHLKSAGIVKSYLEYVKDPSDRALVADVIQQFVQKLLTTTELPSGIIHGDINEQNIVVEQSGNGEWKISSVLDFGDVNCALYLFDIAAAMCYMMLDGLRSDLDALECGAEVLAGYQSIRPLTKKEQSLLKIAVSARLCQSLVLGLYTKSLQPENLYVGDTQANGWAVLRMLWNTSAVQLAEVWSLIG